jgi:hypothetical protein
MQATEGMVDMIYSVLPKRTTPKEDIVVIDEIDYIKRQRIAFKGKCRVVTYHDPFWGEGKTYRSKVFINPTWQQLFTAAKSSQKITGDYHHNYFEGFRVSKPESNGDITILHLSLGS